MSKASNSTSSHYGNSRCVKTVWNGAPTVRGKDPELYRRDPYGKVVYWHSHGKSTTMGWQVDHIKPASKGGSDHPRNLQVMQSSKNMSLGNSDTKLSYKSK